MVSKLLQRPVFYRSVRQTSVCREISYPNFAVLFLFGGDGVSIAYIYLIPLTYADYYMYYIHEKNESLTITTCRFFYVQGLLNSTKLLNASPNVPIAQ